MIGMITTGILLGLSAGLSPGPLLTIVIAETIRHDIKAGIRVALAPLITDVPIIAVTVYIVSRLSQFDVILGCITLVGGGLVLFLGYESLRTKPVAADTFMARPHSLLKGIAVNAMSPHPYLFWFSVGGPILLKALENNMLSGILFLSGFYLLLVGSKVMIALLVNRSRAFLQGKAYPAVMRMLGILLIGFSVFLFQEGLVLLGFI
ncbi:MAG: LysE family translocator [Desulfobacteraceae bacterium]|nr:MAG: LysE family translocator [Desulfobacteraceae bacterium]